ncbi:unnamed protein product [Owenia fusiformis]|uniref:Uncharacterized protein n=2 Tax=Owenia fusiformis TaxID=6347 RepID=A0A8J1UP58_OWEFU|nr:unnamed protein product [Owenia fusiformis]
MLCPLGKKCCATCKTAPGSSPVKHCLTPTNPNKPGICPKVIQSASVAVELIVAPLPEKRGLMAASSSRCGRPCKNDCDCGGIQKCCKAGSCGMICMNPVKPKNPRFKIKKCKAVSLVPTRGNPGFPGAPTDFAVGLACCCNGACQSCWGNCCTISSPNCFQCA